MLIEVLIWAVRIFCVLVILTVSAAAVIGSRALLRPPGRHQAPAPALPPRGRAPDYNTGSMMLDEEERYLFRRDGIVHIDRNGDVDLAPWEAPHGAEAGAIWPKQELWNGHIIGCLAPNGDHHWTACPEEGDLSDDDPVPPLPDMLPAGPAEDQPSMVDSVLALAAADPGDAGWTDQLLADLRDAPTSLDELEMGQIAAPGPAGPQHLRLVAPQLPASASPGTASLERLADTGEITMAGQRADFEAELRAQDDDAAEYLSRLAFDMATYRLSASDQS